MQLDNIVHQQGAVWRNDSFAMLDFLVTRTFKLADTGIDLTFGINNLLDNRYAKNFFERDPGRVVRGEVGLHF
jgi:outer membrane receptor protein involved in Fe transport